MVWLLGLQWAISELFFYTWDYWISVVKINGVPLQCPLSLHAGAASRASVSSSVSMVTAAVATLSVKEIRLWPQTEYLQQSAAFWRHVWFAGNSECTWWVCTDLQWEANLQWKCNRYITHQSASHIEDADQRDESAKMTHVQIRDIMFNYQNFTDSQGCWFSC